MVLLVFITVCDCFICLIAFCLSLPLEPNFHESGDLPVSLIVIYLASSLQYLALSKHPVFVKLMDLQNMYTGCSLKAVIDIKKCENPCFGGEFKIQNLYVDVLTLVPWNVTIFGDSGL